MKMHKILKMLSDAQLDKLMEIIDKFGFSVAEAMVIGYDDIMSVATVNRTKQF